MKKNCLLYEKASLQYEGRAPQVQVFGFCAQGIAAPKTGSWARQRYIPMHEVAPSAVTIAVHTDAMI